MRCDLFVKLNHHGDLG